MRRAPQLPHRLLTAEKQLSENRQFDLVDAQPFVQTVLVLGHPAAGLDLQACTQVAQFLERLSIWSGSRFICGCRLLFWLLPVVSPLSDNGYCSGVVLAFSTRTPSTRRWIEFNGRHFRSAAGATAASGQAEALRSYSSKDSLTRPAAAPK